LRLYKLFEKREVYAMIVELNEISKSYRKKNTVVPVLRDFSYRFEGGNMYLVKGSSGRGKTTLLTIIALLQDADKGTVQFDDEIVSGIRREEQCAIRRKAIGIVFQDFNLINSLTVLDNITLIDECLDKQNKSKYIIRARKYLSEFGIDHRSNHMPMEISTGEQQRVSLIRAIAKEPQLLICDEPVSNLDGENSERIANYINDYRYQNGNIVIVASHDGSFDGFSDKIIEV
jgi:putative ABC transport system ATP-binding protein